MKDSIFQWTKWMFPKIGVPLNYPFSIINHPFWGTLIFGNTQMGVSPTGTGADCKLRHFSRDANLNGVWWGRWAEWFAAFHCFIPCHVFLDQMHGAHTTKSKFWCYGIQLRLRQTKLWCACFFPLKGLFLFLKHLQNPKMFTKLQLEPTISQHTKR